MTKHSVLGNSRWGEAGFALAVNLIFSGLAAAATPEALRVFEAAPGPKSPPARLAHLPAGSVKAIRLNRAASVRLRAGDEMVVDLPRVGPRRFVHDRIVYRPNGDVTIVGRLKGHGPQYRIIVTTGESGSVGRMLTPDGLFRIEPSTDGDWIVDVDRAGLKPAPMGDDARVPQTTSKAGDARSSAATAQSPALAIGVESGSAPASVPVKAAAQPSSNQIVDLMILYTPGMVSTHGAGLATRLDYLVELANQAYIDSGVHITLRLVRIKQVAYADSTPDNNTALDQLTDSHVALNLFTDVERSRIGADMVVLIRPYDVLSHGSCGVAWINNNSFFLGNPESNYAVMSDGDNGGYYCSEYALAHELGHNMGSAHDRANASIPGISPYSYGYGIEGSFGTIMSYFHPQVGMFSNPATTCSTSPFYACGIVAGEPNEANNALSLNDVASVVANSVSAVRNDNDLILGWPGYGIWKRTENGAITQLHPTNAVAAVIADLDGNGQGDIVVDFGPTYGVWMYMNGSATPTYLHGGSPDSITAANLDGDAKTDLVFDYGAYGLWKFTNNGTWTQLHPANPARAATGNTNGSGADEIIVDFGPSVGTFVYVDGGVTPVYLTSGGTRGMDMGDIDGDGKVDVIINFGAAYGVWTYKQFNGSTTTVSMLAFANPSHMVSADLNANGVEDVVMVIGSDIWAFYDGDTAPTYLRSGPINRMTTGNFNASAKPSLIVDFGSTYGIWAYVDNASWNYVHGGETNVIESGDINMQ